MPDFSKIDEFLEQAANQPSNYPTITPHMFTRLRNFVNRFSIRHDLGIQLMLAYILFVGLVVLTTLLFAQNTRNRLEADIKAADLALARSIAQETDYNMRNAIRSVRVLGDYDFVMEPDKIGMRNLFGTMISVRPDISSIYRLNNQGFMLYHYPEEPVSIVGDDLSYQSYFQRAQVTTRPLISSGFISPLTGHPVATAVMPLWDVRAEFRGLVSTNIKLASLSLTLEKITKEYDPQEEFLVVIVDSAGQYIAHPNEDYLLTPVPASQAKVAESVLLGKAGNQIEKDETGKEFLYSFVPVSSPGWGVIVSRPTETAFATSRGFYRGVLLILASFVVVGVMVWIGLYRQAIRPLGKLADYSQTIGRDRDGALKPRVGLGDMIRRSDQVGYLTRSLIRMENAIEDRLNELATLLQTSASVLSSLDRQTVLNRILDQVEQLLNVEMSAIVALDERLGVFRVQASHGFSNNFLESLAISPHEPNSITSRAIRDEIPIQVSDTETDPLYNLPYQQTDSSPPDTLGPRERARAAGYRSLLTIPLNTLHTPPSALLVFRPDPHEFSEQEITLLSNFANQAAMAIENAALYARSDTRLQEQTRRLESLIQSQDDGLILGNLTGKILYANRSICEWVNVHHEDLIGSTLDHLIDLLVRKTVDPDQTRDDIQAAIESLGEQNAEISIDHDRQKRHLRWRSFIVTDAQDYPIGYGQIIHDNTADYELDRLKTNLISAVSHEIRTPLASIKGYTTTLLAEDVEWDVQSQHEFLKVILDETDRLSDLVRDLLDLSRIEAGSLSVSRTECDFSELVQRAAERSLPHPGSRLKVEIATDLPYLMIDRQRIEVVMRNLIENAAKYSGPDLPIHVRANLENGDLVVSVKDQGPGIPESESQRIFERFYRLADDNAQMTPGVGLGLSICRGFVKAHGGEIWVEPSNTGGCVIFRLPVEKVPREKI